MDIKSPLHILMGWCFSSTDYISMHSQFFYVFEKYKILKNQKENVQTITDENISVC